MNHPRRIPGRYIVRFKPNVADASGLAEQLVAQRGGRVYQPLRSLKGFWGELPAEAIDDLRRNPYVAYIEADIAIPIAGVGDTTQSSAPWPLDRIDQRNLPLNGTYQYSVVGTGVHIWIVDDGVSRNTPDLAGRISETWSVTNNGKDPYVSCAGHGTAMAIAAAGRINGIAKNAIIHSARVDGPTCETLSSGHASFAFEVIGDWSPRPAVANYSASSECEFLWFCGPTVDDAAKYARQKGVTVVVAAGNGDEGVAEDACGYTPAHVNELITVSASSNVDQRHSYANYGSCVDLFAPVDGGTSTATAMVTGTAALHLQLYPTASPTAVSQAIIDKVTKGVLSNIGSGSPNRLLYTPQLQLTVSMLGPSSVP